MSEKQIQAPPDVRKIEPDMELVLYEDAIVGLSRSRKALLDLIIDFNMRGTMPRKVSLEKMFYQRFGDGLLDLGEEKFDSASMRALTHQHGDVVSSYLLLDVARTYGTPVNIKRKPVYLMPETLSFVQDHLVDSFHHSRGYRRVSLHKSNSRVYGSLLLAKVLVPVIEGGRLLGHVPAFDKIFSYRNDKYLP